LGGLKLLGKVVDACLEMALRRLRRDELLARATEIRGLHPHQPRAFATLKHSQRTALSTFSLSTLTSESFCH